MSNRLPVDNGESKRLMTARRLLATGAVLLLIGGCSNDRPGFALPKGTDLEHVDVSDKDAKATIYDRIQSHAEIAASKLVELINRDGENDSVYASIGEDEKKPGTFSALYEFGYDSQTFGPSKFSAYMSLRKDADGKLDSTTVDFISLDTLHSKDNDYPKPWTDTVILKRINGAWCMITHTDDPLLVNSNNPDGESFIWGGSEIPNPKAEMANIDRDLADIFDTRFANLVSHAPVAS